MSKKIFSIRFTSYQFESFPNPELSISINFDEDELITNVNSILESKRLKYRNETPLTYSYKEGMLTVTGLAGNLI